MRCLVTCLGTMRTCLSLHLCTGLYMSVRMPRHTSVHRFNTCLYTLLHTRVCAHMSLRTSIPMSIYMFVSMSMHTLNDIFPHVYTHVYTHVHMHAYMHMSAHTSLHVSAHVHTHRSFRVPIRTRRQHERALAAWSAIKRGRHL